MKNIMKRIREYLNRKAVRRKLRSAISILSCIVVFSTTYALLLPALTLEAETVCGMEEHEHTEDCYTRTLICGQEESEGHQHSDECYDEEHNLICGQEESEGHQHTDDCYEMQLTCGKEVHVHSEECYKQEEPETADTSEEEAAEADEASEGVTEGTTESGEAGATQSGAAGTTEAAAAAATQKAADPAEPEKLKEIRFERLLTGRTGIYYIPENGGSDDWEKLDGDVRLDPEQDVILHIAFEIPAGKLNATNAKTEYELPLSISMTEDEVDDINKYESRIFAGTDREADDLESAGSFEIEEEYDDDGNVTVRKAVLRFNSETCTKVGGEKLTDGTVTAEPESIEGFIEMTVSAEDLLTLNTAGEAKYTLEWNDDSSLDTDVNFDAEKLQAYLDKKNGKAEEESAAAATTEESAAAATTEESAAAATEEIAKTEEPAEETAKTEETAEEELEQEEAPEKEETPAAGYASGKLDFDGGSYTVTASFDESAQLPEGVQLSAKELTGASYQKYLSEAGEAAGEGRIVTGGRFFDLTFTDADGNPVEPQGEVSVSIAYKNTETIEEGTSVEGFRFTEEGAEAMAVEAKGVAENTVDVIGFTSNSFGVVGVVYTAEASAAPGAYYYHLTVNKPVDLTELLVILGIKDEENAEEFVANQVENVEFSAPELVKVTHNGKFLGIFGKEDWQIKAVRNFDTKETLTVSLKDGTRIEVTIRDAEAMTTVTAAGDTYEVTLKYGFDSGLPEEGVSLEVSEIAPEDQAYEEYKAQAEKALGEDKAAEGIRLFDITILVNGVKTEPTGPVNVSISMKDVQIEEKGDVQVVHFQEEGETQVLTTQEGVQVTDGTKAEAAEVAFVTESFSVFGIITAPAPQNANDLDGRSFTIDNEGRYLTSEIVYEQVNKFGKTTNARDAAVWTFEKAGNQNGKYYISTMVNGEKKYMSLAGYNGGDNARAEFSDSPQELTVSALGGNNYSGQYTISASTSYGNYYLNEFNSNQGNGYAWWHSEYNPNDSMRLTPTQPVAESGNKYMVVVEIDGQYYNVLYNGKLQPVKYYPETNMVETDYPLSWTYEQNHLYINAAEVGFQGNDLASDFYRTYISPIYDSAMYTETSSDVDTYPGDGPKVYNRKKWNQTTIQYDAQNHRLTANGQYLGAELSENGLEASLAGKKTADEAVNVYLAKVAYVPEVSSGTHDDHTVNHIDISIKGSANISIPLAYGKYYDKYGHEVYEATEEDHILRFSTADGTLEPINVTVENLKKAEIKATAVVNGERKEIDDAFYISGYSGNKDNGVSTQQIRMEGSFKVSNIPPAQNADNDPNVRQQRKANPIDYTISTVKKVDVPLKYNGVQLYDSTGKELVLSVPVTLSASFNYWDKGNECPPLHVNMKPNADFIQAWKDGKIVNDGYDMSGMDFKLGTAESEELATVPAVEVTKYVQDENGNLIETKVPNEIKVDLYEYEHTVNDHGVVTNDQNSVVAGVGESAAQPVESEEIDGLISQIGFDDNPLHSKEIDLGTSGIGAVYDYDIKNGMVFIREDEDSIDHLIEGKDGKTYRYVSTRIETEYARRSADGVYKGKVHYANGLTSVPEVVGPYAYEGEDYKNTFLEFFIYNVYEEIPTVDVPVEKTWSDFNEEGADWSATFRLQWAPIYEGQSSAEVEFVDVTPVKEITITKAMMAEGAESLSQRTFADLPKYGYDPERGNYRIQYSLEEMSYSATRDGVTYTFTRSTTPGVPDTYTPEGEENKFVAFYPHDAGELGEDDTDYYIVVANHQRASRIKRYIDLGVTKTWSDPSIEDSDDAYATFKVYYNKRLGYRDVSHMSEADKEAEPITVTLKDTNGKVYDTVEVQPHTGLRISTVLKPRTSNVSISVSGGDYSGNNTIYAYYNLDKETKDFEGKAYPAVSCDITLSGDLSYIDSARLLDYSPGSVSETGVEAESFTLNKDNHWTTNLHLLYEETVAGGTADNENVEIYEYYLEEVDSSPEGFAARFLESGTEIEEGDMYNPISSDGEEIEARNEESPELVVKKAWRGIPVTTGYPTVYFSLYQCKAGTDNVGNAHIYEGQAYPYEGAPSKRYENIPLSSSTDPEKDFTWVCPETLPLRDANGNRLAYFVVESPDRGNVIGTSWELYGYSQGYNSETDELEHIALPSQPTNAQIVGNSGTLMIHNKVVRYHEMDVKKQYFMIKEAGSWFNVTADMTKDVVLGFKVIRRVVSKDGNTKYTGWLDYGDEMLIGYDGNGQPIASNGDNDFHLQYAGLWHWTIHDQGGDLNSEHIGLPLEGFYTDPDTGETIAVGYQYSFRETDVYKDLDRTPYPEWTWFSTIVPDRYMDQNGSQITGEFGIAFPNQDGERVANYQASDLIVNKRWLGQPNAEEVYVKIWRKLGEDGEPEDFTEEIAKDVAGDYPEQHPAHGNSNWQGFVDDPDIVDTENKWLILKSNKDGDWTSQIKVQNALIKTTGSEASNYIYYIEEVGYKDKNGVVHKKPDEALSELETRYTRWVDGIWEVNPLPDGAEKSIQLGATGENRLQVMNAPEMDLTVVKEWFNEDGTPRDAWRDSITFQIEQVSSKYNANGEPTGETKTAIVKIDGNDRFTIKKTGDNAHWIIHVNHDQHEQYSVDREDSRTNDNGDPWTFYVDGLQKGYFDADNGEWHCVYNVKEVDVPKSEVTISNNGVSTDGKTITINNEYSNTSAVKIEKVFSGIEALPDNFKITAVWTDENGEHNIELTTSGTQPENVTLTGNGSANSPYVWTISKIALGTEPISVTFTESGFESEDTENPLIVTVSSTTDTNVNNDNPVTVVAVDEEAINSGNFTNTYAPSTVDIKILKKDGVANKPLAGAKFSLWRSDSEEGSYSIVTEIEGVTLDENHWFEVPEDGVTLEGIGIGFYKVVEEKAPSGYVITDSTPVRFEVNSSGEVVNKSIETVTYNSEELSFTVPNTPGSPLPDSGGIGTTLFTALGSIISIFAAVMLLLRRNRMKSVSVTAGHNNKHTSGRGGGGLC